MDCPYSSAVVPPLVNTVLPAPHAIIDPSLFIATVWNPPAVICVHVPKDAGTVVCPLALYPQHTTTPVLLSATE